MRCDLTDTHTHTHRQTDPTTVTLAAHARRGLTKIGLLSTSRGGHGYSHLHSYCMCTNLATWLALQCYRFYKYTPASRTVEVCFGKCASDWLTLVEEGVVPIVKKDSYIHRYMTNWRLIYLSACFLRAGTIPTQRPHLHRSQAPPTSYCFPPSTCLLHSCACA